MIPYSGIPKQLLSNPNPRPVREMTDAEREALLVEVLTLHAAIQDLPDWSSTLVRISAELRINDDGSEMPNGMTRHPASEEFEQYDSDLDDAYDAIRNLKEAVEQSLVSLLARLRPWRP